MYGIFGVGAGLYGDFVPVIPVQGQYFAHKNRELRPEWSSKMTLKIKGWAKFQHFKDRNPPWIKLYRDILDDPDWHALDGNSAKVLMMLWLVASEDEHHTGALPDIRRLAFRLRINETKLTAILAKLSHWLIRDDISAISARYQRDTPETETERETETETYIAPTDEASGSEPDQPNPVPDKQPPHLRVQFQNNRITGLDADDLQDLTTAYPAVNLDAEIQAAANWLTANPAKRKKNIYRFLCNWLSRAQERGGSSPANSPIRRSTGPQIYKPKF